jgi:hypothetical protein
MTFGETKAPELGRLASRVLLFCSGTETRIEQAPTNLAAARRAHARVIYVSFAPFLALHNHCTNLRASTALDMTVQPLVPAMGHKPNSTVKRALCIAEFDTISLVNDTVELLGWRLDVVETVVQANNSLKHDNYEAIITAVSTAQASFFDEHYYDEQEKRTVYKSKLFQHAISKSPSTFRVVYGFEAVRFPDIREACFECGADAVVDSSEDLFSALFALMTPPEEKEDPHTPGHPQREQQLMEIAGGTITKRLEKMVRQANELKQQISEISSHSLLRPKGTLTRMIAPLPSTPLTDISKGSQSNCVDSIRVVSVSDTNGSHRSLVLPSGNLFLHSGNFTEGRTSTCLEQFHDFLKWLEEEVLSKFDQVCFIAGNQDFFLDIIACKYNAVSREAQKMLNKFLSKHRDVAFLENTSIVYRGLRVYGSSTTLIKGEQSEQEQEAGFGKLTAFEKPFETYVVAPMEQDCDILVTHRPPSHLFAQSHYELPTDQLYQREDSSSGCDEESKRPKRVGMFRMARAKNSPQETRDLRPPMVHAFGHYSRDFGIEDYGGTLLLNGSQERILKEDKYGGGAPLVVDLPIRRPTN